ncbi:Uncharacterised protein [Mycobacteroides abscessus subsp. massiliense]|nr:Uncharacterised protein [Mycobacteroides abscessus subsp. massiliense]
MYETSAALAAEYMETPWPNMKAPTETTLSTAACELFTKCGSAACTRNTGPRRFTPKDLSHPSTVKAPTGSVSALAALFTTMSRTLAPAQA